MNRPREQQLRRLFVACLFEAIEGGWCRERRPIARATVSSRKAEDLAFLSVALLEWDPVCRRSAYVLCRRFGFDGRGGTTRVQIAKELGVSSGRVLQIEAKAFRVLARKWGVPWILTSSTVLGWEIDWEGDWDIRSKQALAAGG